jgi:predicted TIM-barrel enzyme
LGIRPIEESAYDAAYFLADAVIISGKHTGKQTSLEDVQKVKAVLPEYPVFIGSGTNKDNVRDLFEFADGAVVGTSVKADGLTDNPVCYERVREFMTIVNGIRSQM